MKAKIAAVSHKFKLVEMMITMLASVVGVGFVTGVEVWDFFAKFGIYSVFGIIVFFVLFSFLMCKIFSKLNTHKTEAKMQNINTKYQKSTILNKFCLRQICLNFNLVMIASAMFAGLRSVLFKLLKHNYVLVFLLCVLLIFLLLVVGIKGLSKISFLVIAFLLFVVVVVCHGLINENVVQTINIQFEKFDFYTMIFSILFACIYVFMNIVEIEPVANEFGVVFERKSRVVFGVVFSLIMTMFIVVFGLFLNVNKNIAETEMPLLTYFFEKGRFVSFVFCLGLVLCLLSTLLTCLLGVRQGVTKVIKTSNIAASFVCVVLCLIVGSLKFSFFAKVIYPIIGVVNFFVFVFM